ncbi:hypothetical protein HNY73_014472 [Argiope bruennichi]|uniref:Uncharacterized protein n=1 Tax=Argiope bruennichi TaxID=94029 RepID=A0A8T0ETA5_ARGBR|nr:hypothetical protein HNY73_014472 [Argiope bruennichi]
MRLFSSDNRAICHSQLATELSAQHNESERVVGQPQKRGKGKIHPTFEKDQISPSICPHLDQIRILRLQKGSGKEVSSVIAAEFNPSLSTRPIVGLDTFVWAVFTATPLLLELLTWIAVRRKVFWQLSVLLRMLFEVLF